MTILTVMNSHLLLC